MNDYDRALNCLEGLFGRDLSHLLAIPELSTLATIVVCRRRRSKHLSGHERGKPGNLLCVWQFHYLYSYCVIMVRTRLIEIEIAHTKSVDWWNSLSFCDENISCLVESWWFLFSYFFYRFSNSFDASLPPLMRDHFLQESWFAMCLSFCRGEAYRTNEGIQTCSNETFKARNFNKEQRNKKMMCSKGIVEENGRIKNSLDHWGVRPSPKNDFCFPELLVRTFRITMSKSPTWRLTTVVQSKAQSASH